MTELMHLHISLLIRNKTKHPIPDLYIVAGAQGRETKKSQDEV